MMGCVSRKNGIAWLRMMLMMLLHMKAKNMNKKEDGKSVDQENW
jgi:hypothetical protein